MRSYGHLALPRGEPKYSEPGALTMPCILSALIAGGVLWSTLAVAADKLEVGPAPAWVIPSNAPPSTGPAPTGDFNFLLEDRQLNLSKEGDEIYSHTVVTVLSPRGLAPFGTIKLMWNPDTSVIRVHALRILHGGETTDVLAKQSFTVLRREVNLDYAALDGILTAAIQPTGLQVGDTIELEYTLKRSDPVLAGHSEWNVGGYPDVPIAHARLRAVWDAGTPIRWKASESMEGMREHRLGEKTEVIGDYNNAQPLIQPQGAPARFAQSREAQFTGFKSWGDIARLLAPLYERAARLPDESPLHAELSRIRAASPDPVARAEAALQLVQDQVRYVYLGMNDGGLVPAAADLTWTRRFGDCKAKTVLLLALLEGLGIEAQPVAVSTTRGDGLEAKLPMIGWFDHVLVKAQIAGKTYWLDGARSGDRHLANVPDFGFHWCLPLIKNASELVSVPVRPLDKPNRTVSVHIDASAGIYSAAPFHVEMDIAGDPALAIHYGFVNISASELDRQLRDYWKTLYDFVDIAEVFQSFDEQSVVERWTMDGTAHMDWSSGYYETDGLGLGYKADFQRQPGPHKDAPFAVPFPSYSKVMETIRLPYEGNGFTIDGADIDRTIGGVEYRRHATLEKADFAGATVSRSLVSEFPESESVAVQQALRDLSKQTLNIRVSKDYVDTEQDRKELRAKTPKTADEFVTRGNLFFDDNDYDRAIADFDQALVLDPKDDMTIATRGLAKAWQHKSDLAAKDFEAAYELNPKNPVISRGRGILALHRGDYKKAVEYFSESLTLSPENSFTLEARARAYSFLHESDKALAAIQLSPTFVQMYVFRADEYIAEDKPKDAALEADALLAAMPEDYWAFMLAGKIYRESHRAPDAMAALNRAVELKPGAESYLWRAANRPISDLAGRGADIGAAVKVEPHSVEALTARANVEYETHHYADEIATLNELIKATPDSVELLVLRAIVYSKNGQEDLARKDLSKAQAAARIGVDFNDMCRKLAIANVYLDVALKSCTEALEKSSQRAHYNDSRALVLLRMGRFEDSIAEYDRALALDAKLASSFYGRGLAKRRKGDVTGGDADIAAARALDDEVAYEFSEIGAQP